MGRQGFYHWPSNDLKGGWPGVAAGSVWLVAQWDPAQARPGPGKHAVTDPLTLCWVSLQAGVSDLWAVCCILSSSVTLLHRSGLNLASFLVTSCREHGVNILSSVENFPSVYRQFPNLWICPAPPCALGFCTHDLSPLFCIILLNIV